MRRRGVWAAIAAVPALVVGACSSGGDGPPAPSVTTTARVAEAGPPTTDPTIRIVLGAGRLTVGGNALVFDAPASQVSSYLERALGDPAGASEQECGPGRLEILEWSGLQVFLLDGRLVGWNARGDTYETDRGVALGSTREELQAAYPAVTFPESTLGEEFFVEGAGPEPAGLSGVLEGDEVAALWSGATCVAR